LKDSDGRTDYRRVSRGAAEDAEKRNPRGTFNTEGTEEGTQRTQREEEEKRYPRAQPGIIPQKTWDGEELAVPQGKIRRNPASGEERSPRGAA
jgi:hypothetical protein